MSSLITLHKLQIIANLQNSDSLFYMSYAQVYCWRLKDRWCYKHISLLSSASCQSYLFSTENTSHFLLDFPAILYLLPEKSPAVFGFVQIFPLFPFAPAQPLGQKRWHSGVAQKAFRMPICVNRAGTFNIYMLKCLELCN